MYNPQNAKEAEPQLPKDSILDGAIITIDDGQVKDFISAKAQKVWDGDVENPAINITLETKNGDKIVRFNNMFTYYIEDGVTVYKGSSNLGKYKAKYKKLPEVQDVVKIITDSNGYGKIKLD